MQRIPRAAIVAVAGDDPGHIRTVTVTVSRGGGISIRHGARNDPRAAVVLRGEVGKRTVNARVDDGHSNSGAGDTELPEREDAERLVISRLKLSAGETHTAHLEWEVTVGKALRSDRGIQ